VTACRKPEVSRVKAWLKVSQSRVTGRGFFWTRRGLLLSARPAAFSNTSSCYQIPERIMGRRPGRPPLGARAMSAAEKQRRYRERKAKELGNDGAVTKSGTADTAKLEARIRRLEAELVRETAAHEKTRAELQNAIRLAKEIHVAHVRELEAELKREQAAKAGSDALTASVAELEAELARARDERDQFGRAYWDIRAYLELRTEGIFTKAEFNRVRSMLHPDKAQGPAEQKRYAEAFHIFSRCEKLLKKEPLPPPPRLGTRAELMEARLRVQAENRARGLKAAATRARKKPGRQLRHDRTKD
jgi:chromosome segregation ATPase